MTALPSTEVEVINALSLLAHKVAPNVFDLSSLQWHVSIRDQIVRAQLLMADLKRANPKVNSVLIVGMGAAGISAAMTACELDIPQVYVVDQAGASFELFRGVTSRFVGPFMYEWPSSFHAEQGYPSHASTPWSQKAHSPLTWNAKVPISADALAKELEKCLTEWIANRRKDRLSLPHLLPKIDPAIVKSFVKSFADVEKKRAAESSEKGRPETHKANFNSGGCALQPDYLILAAGMGKEKFLPRCRQTTPSFWANDTLKHGSTQHQQVVVLGGGDGALQDTFRALTNYDHPLSFVQDLQRIPKVARALLAELPALLDADRQMRQHAAWVKGSQGQLTVDLACRKAAERLADDLAVRRSVLGNIRIGRGSVRLLVAGLHFDKAYLLNRFVIYLLWACSQKAPQCPSRRMRFEVQFSTRVSKISNSPPPLRPLPSAFRLYKFTRSTLHVRSARRRHSLIKTDKMVVRFGVQKETVPGLQMLQLSEPNESDLKHRATLKGVELPFAVLRDSKR